MGGVGMGPVVYCGHDAEQAERAKDERGAHTMVDELRQVIEQAQQQPEEVQRHIAELIALALEEREWDALVSTPESQRFLAELSREIDEQIAAGEVEDGGFGN